MQFETMFSFGAVAVKLIGRNRVAAKISKINSIPSQSRACEPGNQQTTTKTHQNEASKWPTENLNFIREYTDVFLILRASSSRYE